MRVLAYCLMSNHVHWVVVPPSAEALSRAFGFLHGRYAQHMNTALCRSGHFWQNRFFSCALDAAHTWAAMRYVERNPLRAGLVPKAEHWDWSSTAARFGLAGSPIKLDLTTWCQHFTPEEWRVMLATDSLTEAEDRLRANTYTGRPAGEQVFVQQAEQILQRTLHPRKGGRPAKNVTESGQQTVLFAECAG